MAEYMKACSKAQCISTVGVRTDLYEKPLEKVKVTDFFGAQKYISGIEDMMYKEDIDDFL